ncbi:MAG: hypothetical protein K0R43_552 [Pseudoduganella sp.]|nr:hypothetical protein [Pseudoduganella sp.]
MASSRWISTIAAAVLMPAAGSALANDALDLASMSLEELSGLRVTTVSLRSERLADAPAAVFVITADDIRHSGAASLVEALRLAPNLHVSQQSAFGYVVTARGFASNSGNKMLVLIDGRSVYTPFFSGIFWDAQDVPLPSIERIEVISGPAGTLWGTNAVNGVINVITRRADETKGTLLEGHGGTLRQQGLAQYGAGFAGGAWRIYGMGMHVENTETRRGSAIDDAGHKAQVGFRADWDRGVDQLTLQGDAYRGRRGQPAPGMLVAGAARPVLGNVTFNGGNLQARWSRSFADGGRLQLQAQYDRTERVIDPTLSETLDIGDIQLQYALPVLGRHALVAGAEYRYADDRVGNSSFIAILPADKKLHWASLFVQDTLALTPALNLTAGLRMERNSYTGNEFLPSVRMAWQPGKGSLVWGAVSRTVRAPSRLDRDLFIPAIPPYQLAGGPNFESEVARFIELGFRRQVDNRFSYSVNAYRALYDRLLTAELGPTRRFVLWSNGMRAATRGVEVWGQYLASPNWRITMAATGFHSRFRLAPGVTDFNRSLRQQGHDPRHTLMLRAAWQIDAKRELDLSFRHVGKLTTPEVPNYEAVDLRFAWRPRAGLEVAVGGTNLFGPSHAEFYEEATRTQIERGIYMKVTSRF